MPSIKTRVFAMVESMRPISSLIAMVGTLVGAMVTGQPVLVWPVAFVMITVFMMSAAGMTINDFLDYDIDKKMHPHRPLPSKRLTIRGILLFTVLGFSIAFITAFLAGTMVFILTVFSFGLVLFYEFWSKDRGLIGNMTVGFLSSMTLAIGGAAVGNMAASIILSLIAFFVFVGREIIMDVRDVEGDKINRVTLPMKIGKKNAAIAGSIFLVIGMCITPLPFVFGMIGMGYLVIVVIMDVMITFSMVRVLQDLDHAASTVKLLRMAVGIGLFAFLIGLVF